MTPLSKIELKRQIKRFIADKDRGISIPMFSELAGISKSTLMDVFYYETESMSETTQRRVNKAYMQWRSGMVKVMSRRDRSRFIEYRKEAKPPIIHGLGLKVTSEGIKLRVGLVNRHDYSEQDLDEALRG
jgi:hypothetical protein